MKTGQTGEPGREPNIEIALAAKKTLETIWENWFLNSFTHEPDSEKH